VPGKDFGPPMRVRDGTSDGHVLDPIVECYRRLFGWREVAMHQGSYNIGQKLGMPGVMSILPPAVAVIACFGIGLARLRRSATASSATSVARSGAL